MDGLSDGPSDDLCACTRLALSSEVSGWLSDWLPHQAEKTRHNRNVMIQMQKLFNEGGKVIWVAPSGGRDRKDSSGKFAGERR